MAEAIAFLEQGLRFAHVLTGLGWLGEVLVVAFVLSPALRNLDGSGRTGLLANVFPLVFRLATILGGVAVVTGAGLLWLFTRFRLELLLGTLWGNSMLIAALLGLGLYLFHLIMERKLLRLAGMLRNGNAEPHDASKLVGYLAVIPRVGAAILATAAILMIYAVHYA